MKIGFPSNPRMNIIDEIKWIAENGFDFVDLFLEEDSAVPDRINSKEIRALIDNYGIGVVGHTAWYMPIGSPSPAVRKAAVKEIERYLEVFSETGVKFVTVHAHWQSGNLFNPKEAAYFQIESLISLVASARETGLNIMFEPVTSRRDTIENVAFILDSVPGLYLHLDIGHASLYSRKPEEFINQFGSRLRHVHLHDNDLDTDLHLPLGTGKVDWKGAVRELKRFYDGTITLEIFSEDRRYALISREKLNEFWNSI